MIFLILILQLQYQLERNSLPKPYNVEHWHQDIDWYNLNLWGTWPEIMKMKQRLPEKQSEKLIDMSTRLQARQRQKRQSYEEHRKQNPNLILRRSGRVYQPT